MPTGILLIIMEDGVGTVGLPLIIMVGDPLTTTITGTATTRVRVELGIVEPTARMLPGEVAISMQAVRVQMVSQAARITAHAAVIPPITTEALREARTAARITTVKDSPEAADMVAARPIRRPTHAAMTTTEHTVRLRAAATNRRRAAVKLTALPRAAEDSTAAAVAVADSPEADIAEAVVLTAAEVVAVVVFPAADVELC